MDDADFFDVLGILDEWSEYPPLEVFARAYFEYEPAGEKAGAGDKFFGDDLLPPDAKRASGAPPLSQAPADVQEIFRHFSPKLKKNA